MTYFVSCSSPGRVPHLPRRADGRGHRGVDDDVRRRVEVRDALVGVDHRDRRARGERGVDRRREPPGARSSRLPRPSFGVGVEAVVDVADDRAHGVAEDDRVGDLHHRRLQVHREEHALRLGVGDLPGEELVERRAAHDRSVEHLALEHRRALLEHGDRAVGGDVLDAHGARAPRPSRSAPSSESRRADIVETCDLRVRRPGAHAVRVLAHERLDRRRRAAVGVALAQDRVDRRALDRVVLRARRVGRIVGIVGDRVALRLQLGDRRLAAAAATR